MVEEHIFLNHVKRKNDKYIHKISYSKEDEENGIGK